jgi:hypothetical protein
VSTAVVIIVPYILIKLPVDYFTHKKNIGIINKLDFPYNHILTGLKNGAGIVLVSFGILLLFIPGQGLVTIFTGIMLMNFPGKRKLELYIVGKKPVLKSINWIRQKAGKEKISNIYCN